MRIATLLLAACMSSGCVVAPIDRSTGNVTVEGAGDPLEPVVKVDTYLYSVEQQSSTIGTYFLRGFIPKNGDNQSYQVYVITKANSWIRYDSARAMLDGSLTDLKTIKVDTDVSCRNGGCTHYESVAVVLTKEQLEMIAASDTSIRINGNVSGAHRDVLIPTEEVNAFVAAMETASN